MVTSIKNKINEYEHKTDLVFRHSAVLIPIIKVENDYHLLYEVRAFHIKHQPGDVCFPGGRMEDGEEAIETAIRETVEELNIKESQINIFGEIDTIVTSFNTVIHVFVGEIVDVEVDDINFSRDEVHEVFSVSIDYLRNHPSEVYEMKNVVEIPNDFPLEKVYNGEKYDWKRKNSIIHVFHVDDYFIWGLTAKMTRNFIDIISE